MNVVISDKAAGDLARIYAWLSTNRDPDTSERFRIRTERALKQLGTHPELGPHPGWTTRHQKLRFWVISNTNYIIYYESTADSVSIERVLDGRRDVHRIVESGAEEPPDDNE